MPLPDCLLEKIWTNSIARKLDEFGCFVKNEHDIGKISISDFPEISYLQILFKWWIFHWHVSLWKSTFHWENEIIKPIYTLYSRYFLGTYHHFPCWHWIGYVGLSNKGTHRGILHLLDHSSRKKRPSNNSIKIIVPWNCWWSKPLLKQ